jgi:hypothetical protein
LSLNLLFLVGDALRGAIKYVILFGLIFIVSFAVFYAYFSNLPAPRAEAQRIREYARRYLEEYKNLVEAYGSGLGNLSQFNFYAGYPYHVLGVISEVHGAAVFFNSSSSQTIEIMTIPERIEFRLWPVMKEYSYDTFWEKEYSEENGFTEYVISANLQIGDGKTPTYFYQGKNTMVIMADEYTIRVMPLGRLRIDGMLIYENRMILKGSNEEKHWLPEVAMIDATNEFLRTAKDVVLAEAELREIQGLTLLRAKAEQIGRNTAKGIYKDNPMLQYKDEQEFWKMAEEYGIRTETARKIKDEVLVRYTKPYWYKPIIEHMPEAIINGLIVTGLVAIVTALYKWIKNRANKLKRRAKK